MNDLKLSCYCCGAPITGPIALCTTSPFAVDRVFVVLPEHLEQLDAETTTSSP